jgi:hypothetical protein
VVSSDDQLADVIATLVEQRDAAWNELDDLRRMLAEAGREGPLRDEIAQLLHEVGRPGRIVVALRGEQIQYLELAHGYGGQGDFGNATSCFLVGNTYGYAADIAEGTQ